MSKETNNFMAENKHTPTPWKLNHWENGESGVKCLKTTDGIQYFSGDAVNQKHFKIVADVDPMKHNIQASFEGAHIAEIVDFSTESEANAAHIVLCVNSHESLKAELSSKEALIGELKEALNYCQVALAIAIETTPTGDFRNQMTDANIHALTILKKFTNKN